MKHFEAMGLDKMYRHVFEAMGLDFVFDYVRINASQVACNKSLTRVARYRLPQTQIGWIRPGHVLNV